MFKFDYASMLPNLLFDYPNGNFDRQRSHCENISRIIANSCPAGRFVDGIANFSEFCGHRTRDNYNAYYKNNARNHTDEFEKSWDAFKRATDIDYS